MIKAHELGGLGSPDSTSFHIHDVPHQASIHNKVGQTMSVKAKLHRVETEDHPDGKRMSLHFHVHDIKGVNLHDPEPSTKDDLDDRMKEHGV